MPFCYVPYCGEIDAKGKITIETSSKAAIKLGITEKDVEEVSYKSLENPQPDIMVEEEH